MATREKEPRPGAWTCSLRPNAEFQLRKPPVWSRFSISNRRTYTVTGRPQYCNHLRPTLEGSVRWYAQQAASMCMCMSLRARWKMVHRSYLYVLSVSVMQAGVTCTSFSNCVVEDLRGTRKSRSICIVHEFVQGDSSQE